MPINERNWGSSTGPSTSNQPIARDSGVIGDDPNPLTGQCIGHVPNAVNAKGDVGTLRNRKNDDPDKRCAHNRGNDASEYPSELCHGGSRRTARPSAQLHSNRGATEPSPGSKIDSNLLEYLPIIPEV